MTPYRAHPTSHPSRSSEPSSLARGAWATAKLTVFLAVIGGAGWFLFQEQFRSRLGSIVQEKCNAALVGTDVEMQIGDARFFDGQGMLLTDMKAAAPNISLTAYETFLSMPVHKTELVSGSMVVDAVEMRRVQLEILRPAEGAFDWSVLAELAKALQPDPNAPPRLLPIALLDSQVKFVDQKLGIEKTISDINLTLNPVDHDGRTIFELTLTAASVDVRQFVVKGFIDPDSGEWNAELRLNDALIDTQLLAALPRLPQEKLNGLRSFSGHINGSLYAHGNWKTDLVRWFEGSGSIGKFTLQHDELPSEIRDTSGTWDFSQDGISVNNIAGQFGQSSFVAKFQTGRLEGPLSWLFSGRVERFELENSERAIQSLPKQTRRFLRDFQPRGIFDIDFDLRFDGQKLQKTIQTQFDSLAFNFIRFPYPLSNCTGNARLADGRITYELLHETEHRTLSAKGVVVGPGKDAVWRCDLKVEKGRLPFDEKLQVAMEQTPALAKVVHAFNAHGWITGSGRLERLVAGGDVDKRFNIDVVDLTMRHDSFPYTIEGVAGNVQSVNQSFQFQKFTGQSGIGRVACGGTWNLVEGLNVRYQCRDIQLDGRLRQALRPELKDVWDGFRPEGTVDSMTVDMKMPPASNEVELVVDAKLHGEKNGVRTSNLTITPTWFPYKLNNLAGKLAVGHGKVTLREFQGQHDRTTVVCDGDGSYSDEGWDMRLSNLLALSLKADGPLLRALPESLATPIEFMKFKGLLNVHGTVTLAGQYRSPTMKYANNIGNQVPAQQTSTSFVQPAAAAQTVLPQAPMPRVSMGWDARFDMNQAELFLGIPLKNVFGMFELMGQFDGENVECRGSVDLDSLTVYDAQITQVRGPVWFDNYQALAGGLINQVSRSGPSSASITGKMYGGVVKLDAAVSSDAQGRFLIQTSLADGDLEQLSNDLAPSTENVEGHTFAALTMRGDATGTHTCRGNGQIHVRDAKIYELPPVVRLLKLFQVRRLNDVAFDSGDIFFDVSGENIDINRMEFNGDAISIIGNGQMNFDHELDLNFYSVVGRNNVNIPLISDLYRRSSQKFMWINVGGTAQDPKITKEILPGLNGPLKQLFQQETP